MLKFTAAIGLATGMALGGLTGSAFGQVYDADAPYTAKWAPTQSERPEPRPCHYPVRSPRTGQILYWNYRADCTPERTRTDRPTDVSEPEQPEPEKCGCCRGGRG